MSEIAIGLLETRLDKAEARLAALEAKSAKRSVMDMTFGSAVPPRPSPKLERELAPGWVRLRGGDSGLCSCGGQAVFLRGENVVCCDAADCMRKHGACAPLASAGTAQFVRTECYDHIDCADQLGPHPVQRDVYNDLAPAESPGEDASVACARCVSTKTGCVCENGPEPHWKPAPPVAAPVCAGPFVDAHACPVHDPRLRTTPPVAAPTCKDWCGLPINSDNISCNEKVDAACYGAHGQCLCTPACRDAGKPLSPQPKPQPAAAPDVHVAVGPEAIDECLADAERAGELPGQPGWKERIEARKAAATAPVTHKEARSIIVGRFEEEYFLLERYICEREAREAELRTAVERLEAARVHAVDLSLGAYDNGFYEGRRQMREEDRLAAERAKSAAPYPPVVFLVTVDSVVMAAHATIGEAEKDKAKRGGPARVESWQVLGSTAPAPGGTNRDDHGVPVIEDVTWAVRWSIGFLQSPDGSVPAKAHDALVAKLTDVAREAEARGRNAAHGEAVRKWARLAELARTAVLEDLLGGGPRCDWTYRQVARAALAELAGAEET